jgi:hypothetical protein
VGKGAEHRDAVSVQVHRGDDDRRQHQARQRSGQTAVDPLGAPTSANTPQPITAVATLS